MPKIHPLADVQSNMIGVNTHIWQFAIVLKGAVIGKNCNINCQVFIENDVHIGDEVTVKSGVQIWNGINIENKVFIGPNATFTNDLSPRSKQYPEEFPKTYIREGATLGANVTVLPGLEIGKYAMLGAGSVLTKNIGPFELWHGNPARKVGYVTREGQSLDLNLKDKSGLQYVWSDNELKPL